MQIDFGIFVVNFEPVLDFFGQPIGTVILELMAIFGWVIFAILLIYLGLFYLVEYKEELYKKDWKWHVLAIDIPPLNVQTPKAVEQMFSHLAGAFDSPDIANKYRHGYKQRAFSFEIISIEGYIQFLIRTESAFRDLVEAAVYAQYPEAEIVEVEDYVDSVPQKFPNDTHEMWAADFGLAENEAYPIRSYREFEHSISKDTVLKDPMGTFLESFTRIGPGEQMWFQIIVEPISNSWKEKAINVVKELIGEKSASKKANPVTTALGSISKGILDDIDWQMTGREYGASSPSSGGDDGEKNQLRYLTPGQTKVVEAIEEKITKIGFKTKMRGVYVARKEVFQPTRGVHALIGAINQFNVPSANSIVPKYGVSASYFFKEWRIKERKNLLMKAYRKRKSGVGANSYVMNIEELATVWHFPMSHVKAPLVQKAAVKAVEPPAGLPVEGLGTGVLPPGLAMEVSGSQEPSPEPSPVGYDADAGPDYGKDQQFG